jgi:hypothetical protein
LDNFRNISKPNLSTGPLSAPGSPGAAARQAAQPAAPTPAQRITGDLSAFRPGVDRQAADNLLNEALPWEMDAPAAPEAPEAPPSLPKPKAAKPSFDAQMPAMPRIPTPPQRGTGQLANSALPEFSGALKRGTTDGLNAARLVEVTHPDIASALEAQLARPDVVAQVPGKSTCVAATVQKTLARQNPQLYALIVNELVGLGNAQLPNGASLTVSKANMAWINAQNFTPDQKLNALVQAALMELGAPGQAYLLASDSFGANPAKAAGLSLDQARKLIETLLKTPVLDPRDLKAKWDGHYQAKGEVPPADPLTTTPSPELVRELLEGAEAGNFAVVRARDNAGRLLRDHDGRPFLEEDENDESRRVQPPKKTHMVQIIAKDDVAGTVTYIDGLGAQRTVEAASFARILLMTSRTNELEGIGSPDGAAID